MAICARNVSEKLFQTSVSIKMVLAMSRTCTRSSCSDSTPPPTYSMSGLTKGRKFPLEISKMDWLDKIGHGVLWRLEIGNNWKDVWSRTPPAVKKLDLLLALKGISVAHRMELLQVERKLIRLGRSEE